MTPSRTPFRPATGGRPYHWLLVLVALLVLGTVACAETEPEVDDAELAEIETPVPPATDYGTTTPTPEPATLGETVMVTLTDSSVDMPATVEAGSVTFEVTNEGNAEHGLTIEGNGISETIGGPIAPGDTATLTANLEPGTYRAYCAQTQDAGVTTEFEVVAGAVDGGAVDGGALDGELEGVDAEVGEEDGGIG